MKKKNNITVPCTLTGTIHIRFKQNKDKVSRDKDSKLLPSDTNILMALSGAFSAYKTMNQEQFKLIVDAFKLDR